MNQPSDQNGPSAPVVRKKTRSAPAVVWLVPIVAALIGAWMIWDDYQSQGPRIRVTFESGAGVEAGKTVVKFRDVGVGVVEEIHLSKDLTGVELVIELDTETKPFLTDATKFWIVRPRLSLSEVSGLDTLVSGVYVEVDPSSEGEPTRKFVGLNEPPALRHGAQGKQFQLKTTHLGSVSPGAPVMYRGITVGEVLGYQMEEDGSTIAVPIFIRAPYDKLVRTESHFWDASGISVEIGANGVELQTASLQALLVGGINFETNPGAMELTDPAAADTVFRLFKTHREVEEERFVEQRRFILYFDGSVRGLTPGASVEFRGIKVGEVLDVRLEFDANDLNFRIPVLIAIEPDRVAVAQDVSRDQRKQAERAADPDKEMRKMIHLGLRARLKTANLITGQLFVDLDFHPATLPQYRANEEETLTEIPTLPMQIEEIAKSLSGLVGTVENLPLDEIATSLIAALRGVEELAKTPEIPEALIRISNAADAVEQLMGELDASTLPQFARTLSDAQIALQSMQTLVVEGSPERVNLDKTLDELAQASRYARLLAAYLERNPNALLVGK